MSALPPREAAQRAQLDAIRRLRGAPPTSVSATSSGGYAGLVTRAIALALDAAIVDGIGLFVAVIVGLAISLLHLPHQVNAIIAAFAGTVFILWTVGYFVFFWSSGGQTPGNRVMCIRVIDVQRRGPLKPRRALLRFLGLCLATIPLGAGLVIMLWDDRRRCLQDRIARTVVIYT